MMTIFPLELYHSFLKPYQQINSKVTDLPQYFVNKGKCQICTHVLINFIIFHVFLLTMEQWNNGI